MKASNRRVLERLQGSDLRSIGDSNAIAKEALTDASVAAALFIGLSGNDRAVRMRAADALEKATRSDRALLLGRERLLLCLLSSPQPKELRWHLLQLVPRVEWPDEDKVELLKAILDCFSDSSRIVQTFALQALYDLRRQGHQFEKHFQSKRDEALASATPALRARARKLSD